MSDPSPRLTVRFWGVRGSIATPREGYLGVGGHTACVEVRTADGTPIILDGGTGIRALGVALTAEAGGRPLDLHVLLSHFHWDHLQGLPFFAPLYGADHRITFVAAEAGVGDVLQAQMSAPFFPVPFEELQAEVVMRHLPERETMEIGGATVSAFPVFHTQPTHGYRIEAEGTVVVYATDIEHGDPALEARLVEAARGADLLICDAQYTPDEYALRQGWGHTTWEHATRLAAEAGVARLCLFHHDPAHDDETLERILAKARECFPATDLARQGETLELPQQGQNA